MKNMMRKMRIISRNPEPFQDRVEAGELLGKVLRESAEEPVVVLGIPRGGVIVAREVADILEAELDVVLTRKLGAPFNAELAIGAVTEDGQVFFDEKLAYEIGVNNIYLQMERDRQLEEIQRRQSIYRAIRPKVDIKGKTAIVVDDGVATGATIQAALWSVKQENPARLIAALPVGPKETLEKLAQLADEVVCLKAPVFLNSVGRFYLKFDQTSDKEVADILGEEYARRGRS